MPVCPAAHPRGLWAQCQSQGAARPRGQWPCAERPGFALAEGESCGVPTGSAQIPLTPSSSSQRRRRREGRLPGAAWPPCLAEQRFVAQCPITSQFWQDGCCGNKGCATGRTGFGWHFTFLRFTGSPAASTGAFPVCSRCFSSACVCASPLSESTAPCSCASAPLSCCPCASLTDCAVCLSPPQPDADDEAAVRTPFLSLGLSPR